MEPDPPRVREAERLAEAEAKEETLKVAAVIQQDEGPESVAVCEPDTDQVGE